MIGGRQLEAILDRPWSIGRTAAWLFDRTRPAWSNARVCAVDVPVDAAAARRWLPPPITPAVPAAATVFVADYPETSFGIRYRECGVLVHGRLHRRPVLHCAWMVVDDDAALTLGRELLGFPKKLATITLEGEVAAGARVRALVRRRDVDLIRIEGTIGEALTDAHAFAAPIANVRGLPSALPPVLWRMDVPERMHAARAADVTITIGTTAWDPLGELLATTSAPARMCRVDIGVPPPGAGAVPRGIVPVALVSPRWLVERYPFRVL